MAKILKVNKNGVAFELGIKAGDELIAFNDQPLIDLLDYLYYDGQEQFSMTILKKGVEYDFDIEKYDYEEIGLELDDSLEIEPIACKNKCKFCFVDQMPKGMRETLYVKDDDYRLSFISGNFITLTNCLKKEMERIIELQLSPLYISVHATDPDVKTNLVANPEARKTLQKLQYLTENNIVIHAQIVFCPNQNDGETFLKTLRDLKALRPNLASVAVVPVGLTKYRDKLFELTPVDEACALNTIDIIEKFNDECGGDFAYASDEFYIKAGKEVPNFSYYGNFCQIENGVGLVATFKNEVDEALKSCKKNDKVVRFSLLTGVSFKETLKEESEKIKRKFKNAYLDVCAVVNNFFGSSITVAGLITAQDIIAQYKNKLEKDVIIPSAMLREFTDTFLDGVKVSELESELDVRIHISCGGDGLVSIIASK